MLVFEGESSISKAVASFEIDEAIKEFTIRFSVPVDDRDKFTKEVNSFTYFYLDEVTGSGDTTHSELYQVDKILKKHRKYDYGVSEIVTLTINGTFK